MQRIRGIRRLPGSVSSKCLHRGKSSRKLKLPYGGTTLPNSRASSHSNSKIMPNGRARLQSEVMTPIMRARQMGRSTMPIMQEERAAPARAKKKRKVPQLPSSHISCSWGPLTVSVGTLRKSSCTRCCWIECRSSLSWTESATWGRICIFSGP